MSDSMQDAFSVDTLDFSVENDASPRSTRLSSGEGRGKDVGLGGDGPIIPAVISDSARRVIALNLHSMVPDDDTESGSSSNSDGESGDELPWCGRRGIGSGSVLQHYSACAAGTGSLPDDDDGGGGSGIVHPGDAAAEKIEVLSDNFNSEMDFVVEKCVATVDASGAISSENRAVKLWNSSRLFFRLLSFFDCRDLCSVMLVCKQFYNFATSDKVWLNILVGANLQPLLTMPDAPTRDHYKYFIEQIITTKAIRGEYSFDAELADSPRCSSALESGGERDGLKCSSPIMENSIFTIRSVKLFLSSASLGQMNHTIGRVHMFIEYKDNSTESINGVVRFSWRRGCFMFCCSSFLSSMRGPVFTVAVSTVHKPWPDQSPVQYQAHRGGLRFIMTPVLLEGRIPGSKITETDVFSVSRPFLTAPRADRSVAAHTS